MALCLLFKCHLDLRICINWFVHVCTCTFILRFFKIYMVLCPREIFMVISFNIVCFNGLHLANPPTWIWMVQFILYGLLQWIASGKPTSVGLDDPIHLYGLLQWIASGKPTSVGFDGPFHLYGLLQWIAPGKPTSVGLDGPIHLYGLLQWIASGKPTSVGLDGSIHFIWVKNLIERLSFNLVLYWNRIVPTSASTGFFIMFTTILSLSLPHSCIEGSRKISSLARSAALVSDSLTIFGTRSGPLLSIIY